MKGLFTTKEAYYLSDSQNGDVGHLDWKVFWENNWWPKVSMFIWLAEKK